MENEKDKIVRNIGLHANRAKIAIDDDDYDKAQKSVELVLTLVGNYRRLVA